MKENKNIQKTDNEFDIAIIGMSCRFPGANNINEFWDNLASGVESITRLSDEEIIESGVNPVYLSKPNYVKASPILDGPGLFDAGFFGFTPREAKEMDPQHRILLECAYEALEHAGYDPKRYNGPIGVYTGSAMNTYFMHSGLRSKFVDEYIPTLIGNDKDFLSTRISYKLNLKGPSINVQTACSTSLVAIHLACQSLLNQESDMALVGAISVKVPHRAGYICEGGGIVSPDGHVRAFDAKANGTVFGSGGGIIVLKRLSDAIADSDTIHAVIKGSAINNDGSGKVGYTAPSVDSQANVIIEALANAGVQADHISYVETHGTGTPVGDLIEIAALTKAFRAYTNKTNYCAIGSVKTNVGHLDAAAGIASIIKTTLALNYGKIPQSLNCSEPNPEINFPDTPFYVNTKLTQWESLGLRRAGVMSTGMGGTNACIVLEEAPSPTLVKSSSVPKLLVLSAKTETALDKITDNLLNYLKKDDQLNLDELAYTLQVGRKSFEHRKFLICNDRTEAIEILEQQKSKKIFSAKLNDTAAHSIVFLMPGIGDHYVGMAYDLYQSVEFFQKEVDRCAQIFNSYLDVDIREIIFPKDLERNKSDKSSGIDLKKMLSNKAEEPADEATQNLNKTIYAQPALFTIEYALAKLWIHWGIVPNAIVGHSMGEYVAACLSGVFSLENALRLIAKRAKLVNELPQGAMLAVTLSERELLPLLNDDISISLINGPKLCVVAGTISAVAEFENSLKEKDILYRYIQNAHAFHSKMLDPIVDEFIDEVKKIKLNEPQIPYISNVTGTWITNSEATDPAYWSKHANHTARFSDALYKMWQLSDNTLLEVGPGKTLSILAMQHFEKQKSENPVVAWSLRYDYENQNDLDFIIRNLGNLWLAGYEINWENFHGEESHHRIPLPTYPFEKENYWIETPSHKDHSVVHTQILIDGEDRKSPLYKLTNTTDSDHLVSQLLKSKKFKELLPGLIEAIVELDQTSSEEESIKDMLYEIEWIAQNDDTTDFTTENIMLPAEIYQDLNSRLAELMEQSEIKDYGVIAKEFDALSVTYIIKAIEELGFDFDNNEFFSKESFENKFDVAAKQTGFLERLFSILKESGYLQRTELDWKVIKKPEARERPEDHWNKLQSRFPQAKIELELLRRSGQQLANILLGKQSPLELLFPDGDLRSATMLYQDSPAFFSMNTLMKDAVVASIKKYPQNKKLRILEIGAGTGGTTSRILAHLPENRTEYVFTDLSNLFLNNAKNKFSAYSFVQYRLLDIGIDPETQEFPKQRFDIIIASNVLHATESIDKTIKNVKKMLAPDGVLIILEGTKAQYWFDLFSGGLEGWMMFKDFDLRKDHPLISNSNWRKILKENEFNNVHILDPGTVQQRGVFGQVVIIAQAEVKRNLDIKTKSNNWLFFADEQGVSRELSSKVRESGEQCTLVFQGEKFEILTDDEVIINPNCTSHYKDLFTWLTTNNRKSIDKIVHLWSLDTEKLDKLSNDNLKLATQNGCGSILNIVQSLIKIDNSPLPSISIITRGAEPVREIFNLSGLAQSPVWGFGRVLALEHPEFKTKRIDLDPNPMESDINNLFREICSESSDDQVAFRDEKRYVPRLISARSEEIEATLPNPLKLDSDKSYLITGGLGSLGLSLTKWMFEQGAKNFVLVDHGDFPNRIEWENISDTTNEGKKIKKIQQLEKLGAKCEIKKADVNDFNEMARVLNQLEDSNQTLKGVIHAAGVYEYKTINEMGLEMLESMLRPKVSGAWNLHQITKEKNLDFFICFSSASSLWGAKGQAHYAAANRFLDTLAHYRHSQGLPALSINWGLFPNTGLINEEYQTWLTSMGIEEIQTEQAFNIMARLVSLGSVQTMVAKIDWSKFKNIFEAVGQAKLFECIEELPLIKEQHVDQPQGGTPLHDNYNILISTIKEEFAEMLGVDSAELLEDRALNMLGLDSLMAVGLRNRINTKAGVNIPMVKFMDGSSIINLVEEFGNGNVDQDSEMVSGDI